MKIIKQGKSKEELKAILKKTKCFECKTCGCVFEADYCECPNCGNRANEVKMREIEKRPKTCYESSCVNHMLSNSCGLSFPPDTVFDGLTGSRCPYYTQIEVSVPGAYSERDKG